MSVTIETERTSEAGGRIESAPPLRVERVAVDKLYAVTSEWADLCSRAMEPNVFLEPGFALPLMSHVSPARRPGIVLVWEDGDSSRLLALLPIAAPTLSSRGVVRAFRDEQAALGTPLLDCERGAEALTAILATIARRWPRAEAMVVTRLHGDGAVARMLLAREPQRLRFLGHEERAVLRKSADPSSGPALFASVKRRKELQRQRRRLAERGTVAYISASCPDAVAEATERFLVLECRGWKGRRGTALLSNPGRAAFVRAAMRRMAENGLCRIDTLLLDAEPVAMGIVMTVRGRACWWKTAYDERFAAFSPGVQFAADLMRRQHGDPTVSLTDSCAIADHPMIGRLWPDRTPFVDLAIALRSKPGTGFRRAVHLERCRRALRAWAKGRWRAFWRR